MKLGENKEETKGRFRWQIGIAIILLIAVAAYLIKLISTQPEEDYKKSGKFTDPVIAVAAVAATQGDFPVYLTGLGTVTALAHGHGEITR